MANERTRPRVRGTALIRRARWLERKIAEGPPDRSGIGYDTAEYGELLWVFGCLGIPFTPADAEAEAEAYAPPPRGDRRDDREDCDSRDSRDNREEPPRRYGTDRSDDVFVPGEPRRSGWYGRGGL